MVALDLNWERLPLAELQQLDAVCVRFEQAMDYAPETRIESFVNDLAEPQRRLVVLELVQVEIERRHGHGQNPTPDEYALRFPIWADELRVLAAQSIEDLDRARISTAPETVNQNTSSENDTKTSQPAHSDALANAAEKNALHESWRAKWRVSTLGLSRTGLPEDGVLGHYRLQQVIGRGGMGVVARAHDTKLARDVAIKVLAAEISQDATAKERFLREARAAAAVRHNHVVMIYAVEEIDKLPLIVMELVDGTTLDEYLRTRGKLSPGEVAHLGYQMAHGLAAAHQRGLIHRDIKPANILLERDDRRDVLMAGSWNVKIADFGLACAAAEARLTSSGLIAGTPQYMSPEQAEGQAIDSRSDLFSLGSVMYTMCAGRAPFEADSPVAIARQVADKPARLLREISPDTPHWLIAIIEKLMAKSPDERFQSAAELAEVLGRHLQELQAGRPLTDFAVETQATTKLTLLRPRVAKLIALAIAGIAVVAFGISTSVKDHNANRIAHARGSQVDPPKVTSATDQDWHGWLAAAPRPAIAPFGADEALGHQAAWAQYLGVPVDYTNSIGMQFRLIPPGEFFMGSSDEEITVLTREAEERELREWYVDRIPFEGSQHAVTLMKPFAMSSYEVTRGQFRQFVEATGYETDAERDGRGGNGWKDGAWLKDPVFLWNTSLGFDMEQTDDHPVVNVSWNDAQAFCRWLSESEGTTFRLPTEAEWEYACRAGSETRYCYGDDESLLRDYSWHAGSSGRNTNLVGQKTSNAFGLFDLYGNVFEWCQDDWYDPYPKAPAVDPTGIAVVMEQYEFEHLMRGGSFGEPAAEIRSALRRSAPASLRNATIGFRPIRSYSATP